ncbi:LamG-like jellyroll fold domain-containing protein [Carboxylicivirga taeanensis]|uniref:LamG-like jellyroll fold domain-containing protein n=1 Tax=Carboxylicivirga taeanensis TaxID=1416875 RepID=UPI003F6E3EB2
MVKNFNWILTGLLLLALSACQKDEPISNPLIAYHFNNTLKNDGMVKTAIYGPQAVSYAYTKNDTSLDLSINATTRQPLSIKLKNNSLLSDYQGYTIAFWVKKYPSDPESYTIISHTSTDSVGTQGWQIKTPANGAWQWWLSDSNSTWDYAPTQKQTINDGNWHLLAFSYDLNHEEARLYYDGKNVAVLSLQNNQLNIQSPLIHLGVSSNNQQAKDLFNGELDDLMVWSRVITANEIEALYRKREQKCLSAPKAGEQFKVMTWNIWDGGKQDGRFVGLQRITNVISQEDPDIVLLQQSGGKAAFIADALNYTLYQRNTNLCVLSRYPIINTSNIFQPETIGCIEIGLATDQSLIVCPIQLSATPDLSAYIQSGTAETDSILAWESMTRGKEAQFILSELKHHIDKANEKPIIVAGDFNSGSHLDWTSKNARHNYGLAIQYPTSLLFERNELTDTYRSIHPDETQHFGYTISPRFDSIMKNRTNFIYYKGERLSPQMSYLIDEHANGFPSDHAALVTVFGWLQ